MHDIELLGTTEVNGSFLLNEWETGCSIFENQHLLSRVDISGVRRINFLSCSSIWHRLRSSTSTIAISLLTPSHVAQLALSFTVLRAHHDMSLVLEEYDPLATH